MNDRFQKPKNSDRISILIPIVTFIFGLIGTKLFDNIFNPLFVTENRTMLTGFFTASVLLVISLFIIKTIVQDAEKREDKWLQQIGIPADLIFERNEESDGTYFQKFIDLVKQIEVNEIRVMSYYQSKKADQEVSEAYNKVREEYSNFLLEKAKEPGTTYHRIMCFEEASKNKIQEQNVEQWMIDHCRKMLEIQKKKPDKISLKVSQPIILIGDIAIINNNLGFIDISIRTDNSITYGSLIFHNPPNAQIIERLLQWFREADIKGRAVDSVPEK